MKQYFIYVLYLYMSDIKKTARAVIILDNKVVLIRRKKYNNGKLVRDYYVIPGGHLDENETFEEAVIREVKEELGIDVEITSELLHAYNEDLNIDEKFFECMYLSGKLGTGIGEEWTNPDIEKYGSYEIILVEIDKIEDLNLLPMNVKKIIIEKYKN